MFLDDSSNLEELNPKLLNKCGDIPPIARTTEEIQLKEFMKEEEYKATIRRKRKI